MSHRSILRRRALRGLLALLALACMPAGHATAATSPDRLWRDVGEAAIAAAATRQIVPASYRTVALDRARLQASLANAPHEADVAVHDSTFTLTLPLPGGGFGEFQVVESPIMEPALAAQFPELRTYVGQGIDDPTATLRFDVTPTGFHGQIISWEGTSYVDPYQRGDATHYIAYRKGDARTDAARPVCHVTGEKLAADDAPNPAKRHVHARIASGATLRTYRLAMAATGEYTQFHGGTVAQAQAAIVTTVNRVNGIYERDLAVRMILVGSNASIIYTNAGNDPYTNDDGIAMLDENQANVTAVIGSGNYDIGHVVSTGGGGVAALRSVCSAGNKAEGVTGSPAPVGDAFDVDYVAHEIGHQFGGNHTFNSTRNACGAPNRNAATAYEVGSGITIQAYAGICSPDNVQNNSADYFHRVSLNEMLGFITTGGGTTCGTSAPTGNTPPIVTAPASFTIPRQTPFTLTAAGSDVDNDALTYIWEQFDLGPTNPSGSLTDNGGPLFRNYLPSTSPSRTFPRPTPASPWELLPSTGRTMNFRVTARDNRAGGGGTNEASTSLTVNAASGPFVVTAPNTAVSWDAGQPQTVTWNVANTNLAPVSTATVAIHLSLDGGTTYPLLLASGEANDGTAQVLLIGATPTTQARIRVSAENNVYFDTSNVNFTITGTPPTTALLAVQSALLPQGNGRIDRNECNELVVTLANNGNAPATAVGATLSSTTPGLTVTQPVAAFDDIPPGESRTALAPFLVTSDGTLACPASADLALEVTYTGGASPLQTTLTLPVGQAANPNYTFATSTGATIPGGGALVAGSQSDDAVTSVTVPTGFAFSVYDTAVAGGTVLRASTNGTLQLVASGGSRGWSNTGLPASGSGDAGAGAFPPSAPVLMPYWDDIDTGTGAVGGGGIYTHLVGTTPNRKWIVEWRAEPVGQAGNAVTVNFAIEFNEGSDVFSYVYAATGGSGANGAEATIGVQAATTGTLFTQHGFNAQSVAPGQRLTAARTAASCAPDAGSCGGLPGVALTESGGDTRVAENGASDTYTLVLTTEPSADVTVAIAADAELTAVPATRVFTPANWNVPQSVTVAAVDDTQREGPHTGTITHTASGGGYDAVVVPSLTVDITDDDFLIGVTVSGLEGDGLVLQNGSDTLAIPANGSASFAGTQATGSSYAVGVQTQPDAPAQECTVANGSGTVGTSDVLVPVTCDTLTTQLAFGVQPGDVAAGAAIQPAVTVRLLDSLGNATDDTRSVAIALADNPGGGTLTGTLAVPAASGVATFASLRIDAEGDGYTLRASASGLPSVTSEAFDVAAGAPAQLAFAVQPSTTFAGEAIAPAVTVRILDADGNTTASTAVVTLTLGDNPGGGALSGTTSVAAVNGVATFVNLSIDAPGIGYTLDAVSPGLAEDTSAAFDVIAADVFDDGFESGAP